MKHSSTACLTLFSLLAMAGCTAGLQHAYRTEAGVEATPSYLLKNVETWPERPVQVVSQSVVDYRVTRPLADAIDTSTLASMRAAAASRGADLLYTEAITSRWRKAYYALGLRYVEAGDPRETTLTQCTHTQAREALERASRRARKCLDKVKKRRPGFAGTVGVIFEIDAFGQVLRAATKPDASHDSDARDCAMPALFGVDFGVPEAFSCRLELSLSI